MCVVDALADAATTAADYGSEVLLLLLLFLLAMERVLFSLYVGTWVVVGISDGADILLRTRMRNVVWFFRSLCSRSFVSVQSL